MPTTFAISDKVLRVHNNNLDLKCFWPNLKVWQLRDNWLLLSPHGMQELYFSVEDLKDAGIFDEVMILTKKYAVEYDSTEARSAN